MANTPPRLVASGNIYPSRFVKISGENQCAQCGAGDEPIGISMEGTNYPPIDDPHVTVAGYAAVSGESLRIYGDGDESVLITAGAAFSAGAHLKADTDGKGIATTAATDASGAVALQAATAKDQLVPVQVQINPAAA